MTHRASREENQVYLFFRGAADSARIKKHDLLEQRAQSRIYLNYARDKSTLMNTKIMTHRASREKNQMLLLFRDAADGAC